MKLYGPSISADRPMLDSALKSIKLVSAFGQFSFSLFFIGQQGNKFNGTDRNWSNYLIGPSIAALTG